MGLTGIFIQTVFTYLHHWPRVVMGYRNMFYEIHEYLFVPTGVPTVAVSAWHYDLASEYA